MKNIFKYLWVIAVALTVSAAAAWAETDATVPGTLTITNIKTKGDYFAEGDYVIGVGILEDPDEGLLFTAGEPSGMDNIAGVRIRSGTVTLKVYVSTDDGTTWSVYTGNDILEEFGFFIIDCNNDAIFDTKTDLYDSCFNVLPVKFSNGSAVVNFGDLIADFYWE
ncbi:MAG: hypothetical protein LBQ89_01715 [Treponema sp.]|nr:hypothetical protein [Treponema sp.]